MTSLETLNSARVFYYFTEICKIPHISYHEKALSDYCVRFAEAHNLVYEQDPMGNLLIIKEATAGYESEPAVMIQGHLDMVGDKLPSLSIDLEKEPVTLRKKGDFIYANGTTLGGDNGVAVAYALAILESDTIAHPRLEVVLTVCEEVGLLGASAMDLSSCQARKLINVDSEIEGILTAGCAGGRRALCHIPLERISCDNANTDKLLYSLTLTGLLGGHSGTEINKGRAKANTLMGRILLYLNNQLPYGLLSLDGGVKESVITNTASAQIIVEKETGSVLETCLNKLQKIFSDEYAGSDPDVRIEATHESMDISANPLQALTDDSLHKVITALILAPCGVQSMSADLPELVETSLNLGVITMTDHELQLRFSLRSSVTTAKEFLSDKIAHLASYLGGTTEFAGDYPAWSYNRISPLRDICSKIYEEMYGEKPQIDIIHAGLECGILSSKIEGLDCISFGPNLYDIHSPNEHMSISSVDRVWDYLLRVLAAK